MFYFFSKLLLFLLNPLFWIVVLLIYSYNSTSKKVKRIYFYSTLLLLFLFGNGPICNWAFKTWESNESRTISKKYDYGVILTGEIKRLYEAIPLYKKGIIDKLVIVGIQGDVDYNKVIADMNIPDEDILIEELSLNTYQNAVNFKGILDTLKEVESEPIRILLITSAFHMYRSSLCFKKQDIHFDEYRTDFYGVIERSYTFNDLFPQAEYIYQWHFLIKEWVGIIVYKLRGYI